MYGRLADFPVLDEYPSRIPAAVWNIWRRSCRRGLAHVQVRFAVPDCVPLEVVLEERLWVCCDPTLADAPVLAWVRFADAGRSDISAPVACTVLQYHFGASRVREAVLHAIAVELERRLKA